MTDEHDNEGVPLDEHVSENILRHARREMTGLAVHYEDILHAINLSEEFHSGIGRNPDLPRRMRKALREAAHCEGLWSPVARQLARKRGWIP